MHPITRWVTDTAQALVPRIQAVEVVEALATHTLIVEIVPGAGNEAFVIGRGGLAINAIRELAIRMGDRSDLHVTVTVRAPRRLPAGHAQSTRATGRAGA